MRNLATGAYRLAITAQNNTAGTYAARISLVPADVTATTAPDGKPVGLSTSAVEILLPQPLELLILGRGQQVGPLSAIGRSLADTAAQRLAMHAQIVGDVCGRAAGFLDQTHREITQLVRVLPWFSHPPAPHPVWHPAGMGGPAWVAGPRSGAPISPRQAP